MGTRNATGYRAIRGERRMFFSKAGRAAAELEEAQQFRPISGYQDILLHYAERVNTSKHLDTCMG